MKNLSITSVKEIKNHDCDHDSIRVKFNFEGTDYIHHIAKSRKTNKAIYGRISLDALYQETVRGLEHIEKYIKQQYNAGLLN